MRRLVVLAVVLAVLTLPLLALAAQHGMAGMQMGAPQTRQEPSAGQPPMMGQGMMSPGMMGMTGPMMGGGMMPMMQQMMGGMMDPSGMGMMGSSQMDAKAMGRMLQLRGEMLKAMGEVLLKHGKAMTEGK